MVYSAGVLSVFLKAFLAMLTFASSLISTTKSMLLELIRSSLREQTWIESPIVTSYIMSHLVSLEILRLYFKERLEELSTMMAGEYEGGIEIQGKGNIDLDERGSLTKIGELDVDKRYCETNAVRTTKLVRNIGKVVRDLRSLGFTSMTEDAYASAIFLLLKASSTQWAFLLYRLAF